ncbi:MAG: hypothetical protein JWR29_279 [Tardiphaga sp.]|nr:hypothetical protein [Tardiphaga sp.]
MAIMMKIALGGLLVIGMAEIGIGGAEARGGGSNFMNSPGYQRRLQESRGYVPNRSGSLVSRPTIVAPPVARRHRRWR